MISRTKRRGRVWRLEDLSPLAAVRSKAGLSREEAAVKLRISGRTLAFYENGKRDFSLALCEDMAELYNVPFEIIRQAAKKSKEEAINGKPFERLKDKAVLEKAVAEANNLQNKDESL